MKTMKRGDNRMRNLGLAATMLLYAGLCYAGSSDPLGSSTCQVVSLFTGKWVFGIAVLAFVAVGGALIWGVEMGEIMKKAAYVVLALTFLVSATAIVKFIWPSMVGC